MVGALVTRSFTAKKPKHRGAGNTLIAQLIKMRLGVKTFNIKIGVLISAFAVKTTTCKC